MGVLASTKIVLSNPSPLNILSHSVKFTFGLLKMNTTTCPHTYLHPLVLIPQSPPTIHVLLINILLTHYMVYFNTRKVRLLYNISKGISYQYRNLTNLYHVSYCSEIKYEFYHLFIYPKNWLHQILNFCYSLYILRII